ncbi:hypothetical protein FXV83_12260 [Bradyrhizobium hipponense]|uniref:Uncharacterized protein n=1 Tax=Bradyrhizobium hipponense TaxID=2605638 RepID=A0A5S4YPG9_9BRAD|nr:hypothetical protein [Bradyrhizobium hipponense]TYO66296.1 hypothetical protein FXV83_12260 [Bradyrhizobium hipponense]
MSFVLIVGILDLSSSGSGVIRRTVAREINRSKISETGFAPESGSPGWLFWNILLGFDQSSRKSVAFSKDADAMNNLTQFGEDLRLHLFRLQASLDNINGLFAGAAIANDAELAGRLEGMHAPMKEFSERAAELREMLQAGLERDAALVAETLSRWVARRQTAQLHARADMIEQLATVAVELATLSAVEAERITMTAIIARRKAVAVQVLRDL